MRRHDALIPLTHDHHHALARARRLRRAADGEDTAEQLDAAREFLRFFSEHTLLHFREEEEELFPLVVDEEGAPTDLLTRILLEHVRLHRLVHRLEAEVEGAHPTPETLREIGDTLKAHIRTEENELFPAIEGIVADSELQTIRLAERHREPPPRPGP